MGKRGQSELPAVIPIAIFGLLLIAAFFFLPIMKEIVNITSEVGFEANFLARDVAMVVNTLYASPGNMIVTYDKNMKWFGLRIKDNVVSIHDQTKPISELATYPFLPDRHAIMNEGSLVADFDGEKVPENLNEDKKVNPVFARIEDGLFFIDRELAVPRSIHSLGCEVGEHSFGNVVVDAADDGYVHADRKESEITHIWGSSVELLISTKVKEVFYTRMDDGRRKRTSAIDAATAGKDVDLIVSLHVGARDHIAKAYYLKDSSEEIREQSRSLGCEILNGLVNLPELKLVGVALIPLDEGQYIGGEGADYTGILRPEVAGLILEIGNIQDDTSYALLTSTQTKSRLPAVIQDAIT